MTTTDERVEITPELLADIQAKASAYIVAASRPGVSSRFDEAAAEVSLSSLCTPELLAALVARIRELESERDAMRLEEDRSGPDAGECGVSLEGAKAGAILPARVNIWSGEHRAWWRAESRGYVYARRGAGVYTAQGAFGATSHCGPEKEIIFYPAKYTT